MGLYYVFTYLDKRVVNKERRPGGIIARDSNDCAATIGSKVICSQDLVKSFLGVYKLDPCPEVNAVV